MSASRFRCSSRSIKCQSLIAPSRCYNSVANESLRELGLRINAPNSLPPPLVLPLSRKESEYRLKYAYKLGKSYLSFYKAGFKQILANRNLVKEIKVRHQGDKLLSSKTADVVDHATGKLISIDTRVTTGQSISRADYQLLRRHAKDIKKVPAFALLLAVFGEWLPLFVVFLDPLIPGTVLLPVQVHKRRVKAAKAAVTDGEARADLVHVVRDGLEGAGIHDRRQLVLIAKKFALLGSLSQFSPSTSILRRIRKHGEYLRIDDGLLWQELGDRQRVNIQALDEVEAAMAVEERGLWREDQAHAERLSLLSDWLDSTKAGRAEPPV